MPPVRGPVFRRKDQRRNVRGMPAAFPFGPRPAPPAGVARRLVAQWLSWPGVRRATLAAAAALRCRRLARAPPRGPVAAAGAFPRPAAPAGAAPAPPGPCAGPGGAGRRWWSAPVSGGLARPLRVASGPARLRPCPAPIRLTGPGPPSPALVGAPAYGLGGPPPLLRGKTAGGGSGPESGPLLAASPPPAAPPAGGVASSSGLRCCPSAPLGEICRKVSNLAISKDML